MSEDENLELNDFIFVYNKKIEENGVGIVYQYIGNNIKSTTEQIQQLYQEVQNIIPGNDFSLKFMNDIFDEDNDDNNYYVEVKYYNEVQEEQKKFVELQLIKHVSFKKVNQ